MATLKSFKGFIPMELGLGRHYINGFEYVDDNEQSYYVATDNAKAYLISSNIINYYPETVFPKVKRIILDPIQFGMTLDEVVDLTEAEITQHQITNYFSDTLAEAKALTYKKQERVKIFELDEVFECVEIAPIAIGVASSTALEVGSDLYFLSYDAGTYGQMYKQTGSVTTVAHIFSSNGNGHNPVGTLSTDGTYIYIENSEGGSNGLGTLVKYNIATSQVTKIIDFSISNGHISGSLSTNLRSLDKVIHNNNLFLILPNGGANNKGTILTIDTSTDTILNTIDATHQGGNNAVSEGFGCVYNNIYYAFYADRLTKVNTTTGVEISSVSFTFAVTGAFISLASGFKDGTDVFLTYDGNAKGFKKYDLLTDTFTELTFNNTAAYVSFKDGNILYAVNWNGGQISKYDLTTNTYTANDTTHSLPGLTTKLNGSFNSSTGILYYTAGSTATSQREIYRYDVAAKTGTLVYDTQSSSTVSTDNEYIIEINQSATANLYLRVRDNHTKSVALDSNSLGIDVTTTRGVTTNIAFPISNTDFWSYQYATNTTSNDALDIKGLAGFKVISDNLTLLSKTASSNVFNGSDLFLPEGIYSIQASFYMNGQVGSNLLKLEVKPIGVSTILTESSVDSNKLFTTRFTTYFDAVLIDSTTATSGIKVRINGIDTAGSFLNIYDIRLNITKIGDNI
jgi:hypothetical protein